MAMMQASVLSECVEITMQSEYFRETNKLCSLIASLLYCHLWMWYTAANLPLQTSRGHAGRISGKVPGIPR